ncbi:SDR family oxidoreductase [Candidatus Pacearchaeota archaeon]|nr:SDR family oxidoreductase [Candidatus Pacearchaeota archaeon]
MRQIAIITGASKGIGKAIAHEFAKKCYDIVLIGRNQENAEKVGDELEKMYHIRTLAFSCDVGSKEEVEKTFSEVVNLLGKVDILVNNAGINSRKTLNSNDNENWFTDFEDNLLGWNQEISTNLTGTYICSYIAAGYMLKQKSGSIINISSIKGKEPTSSPGYGSSKSGVIKLTKDMAKSLAQHNIRVNCIAPGFINTGMTTELSPDKKEIYKAMIPMKRFGKVEEIAKVAAFLASKDSSYITGTTIDVNGGYLM